MGQLFMPLMIEELAMMRLGVTSRATKARDFEDNHAESMHDWSQLISPPLSFGGILRP
jgi:hypothetical protein